MKRIFKLSALILSALLALLMLASCDSGLFPGAHTHDFDEWKTLTPPTCTTEGVWARYCECGEKQSEAIPAIGHAYVNGVCSVCSDKQIGDPDSGSCIHTEVSIKIVEGKPSSCTEDGLTYGVLCLTCNEMIIPQETIPAAHTFGENNVCDVCGFDATYPWNETQLKIMFCIDERFNELSPSPKRFCAGQDTAKPEEVDILVRKRNLEAERATNTKIQYWYNSDHLFNASEREMNAVIFSGTDSAPDIFSTDVFTMASSTVKANYFKNLYANTDRSTATCGGGRNYFSFTKEDYTGASENYFDVNSGDGYFIDYMQSLSFANAEGEYNRMHMLASNYTFDVIRNMQVIPVNPNELGKIEVSASTGDIDGDGDFDIDDLYTQVWSGDWTYDDLALLAGAAYSDLNTAIVGEDILDKIGFCVSLSKSRAQGKGLLYSSPISIINKVQMGGEWTYTYPMKNDDLTALTQKAASLFDQTGVITLTNESAAAAGLGNSDLAAIRSRFAQDNILFGGIISLGYLEDDVYQNMNAAGNGGFGFVPVPLYQQDEGLTQRYNTVVDDYLAGVIGISGATTKFDQCTAFLDYVSRGSSDVVVGYAMEYLADDDTVNKERNIAMLSFVKNHMLTTFDMIYDDIISIETGSETNQWSNQLSLNGYKVLNMSQRYDELCPDKHQALFEVLNDWKRLDQYN